jgi:hypothetical protein
MQFVANLALLCCFWLLIALTVATALGLWTLVRYRRWRRQQQAADLEHYQSTHDAQGRPMPPLGPGVCQGCGAVPALVYYLEDGRHLCPHCLAREGRRAQKPPPPGLGDRP